MGPAKELATYKDLYSIPEDTIGEIIGGELIATPRPAPRHSHVVTILSEELGPPYRRGRSGPGGWIFLYETEIRLGEDTVVPDLAGWRKERFPPQFEHNWIPVSPDWLCEVLSPGSFRSDKVKKMPLYARHGVGYIWLIDPVAMAMDAFRLESGRWSLLGSFTENDKVRVEPFQEIEIDLGDFWV
ncbi:MAG: Uma2 family endonuclease [Syntrophobacteraceae bacterium]|nr:Uma2 family endonuclease [Syntrophobacteraceae bacterium]